MFIKRTLLNAISKIITKEPEGEVCFMHTCLRHVKIITSNIYYKISEKSKEERHISESQRRARSILSECWMFYAVLNLGLFSRQKQVETYSALTELCNYPQVYQFPS